jgi:hypothetical protein
MCSYACRWNWNWYNWNFRSLWTFGQQQQQPQSETLSFELLLRNQLTPRSRVLLEKLLVTQLVKKSFAFYGTRRFITMLTRTRHWSLFWARCIQSTNSHPFSLKSVLILSSYLHLGLSSGPLPSGFPTKILYSSPSCMLYDPPYPWYAHYNSILWSVQVRLLDVWNYLRSKSNSAMPLPMYCNWHICPQPVSRFRTCNMTRPCSSWALPTVAQFPHSQYVSCHVMSCHIMSFVPSSCDTTSLPRNLIYAVSCSRSKKVTVLGSHFSLAQKETEFPLVSCRLFLRPYVWWSEPRKGRDHLKDRA